jgi:hypothetical protein
MLNFIFTLFIVCHFLSSAHALQPASNIEDTDHGSTDWIISADTFIAGVHFNLNEFKINPGVTVFLQAFNNGKYGSLEIRASSIVIAGSLNANGIVPGGIGGSGGGGNGNTGTGTGGGGGGACAGCGGGGAGYGASGGSASGGSSGGAYTEIWQKVTGILQKV